MTDLPADCYPPSPSGVPPTLTAPTGSYRLRVIVVLLSLLLFVVIYLGLVVGSAYLTYHSFAQLGGQAKQAASTSDPYTYRSPREKDDSSFGWVVLGVFSAAICLFLIKGLFKRQHTDRRLLVEVTEKDHPALFAFIRRLCRDTRAPFPHRIYVTPEVNAAVFYKSSFLSLVLPIPKNLMIGLGLVNQLNLSEFKAVLAHELGHFSQSSMKLGSYVYTSNRIIGEIVFGRDWLDDLVGFVRGLDIRIAVFGWAFTGIIWSLRKLLQGMFRAINFTNLALSRQMEFNADLVAVSVTGSDALIHSLARLEFANETLEAACQDLNAAADHKLFTRDLFYHQTQAVSYLRTVRHDPRLGEPPPLPEDPKQTVPIFEPGDGGIPPMWATHPSNYDREQNAKRVYLRSPMDDRASWILFQDPQGLRERVTRRFYQVTRTMLTVPMADPEVVQRFIDDEHAETTYHARYHGLYDDRFIHPGALDGLVKAAAEELGDPARLREVQAGLYGAALKTDLEKYQSRRQDYQVLNGLVNGTLEVRGKYFTFRDSQYGPKDAAHLLEVVEKELETDQAWLESLDRKVYLVHHTLARQLGPEICGELEERYHFHLAVQELLGTLLAHQNHVQVTLSAIAGERRVSQEVFESTRNALRQADEAVRNALMAAEKLPLPALKNMNPGESLARFLMPQSLVPELSKMAASLDGQWINAFLGQLGEIVTRSQRIHFKSLGGILALQERIAGQRAAPHPAEDDPSLMATVKVDISGLPNQAGEATTTSRELSS